MDCFVALAPRNDGAIPQPALATPAIQPLQNRRVHLARIGVAEIIDLAIGHVGAGRGQKLIGLPRDLAARRKCFFRSPEASLARYGRRGECCELPLFPDFDGTPPFGGRLHTNKRVAKWIMVKN